MQAVAPVRPPVVLVAAQAAQLVWPVAAWNVFVGQARQAAMPANGATVPAAQEEHAVKAPYAGCTVPAAHSVQETAPVAAEREPGLHDEHEGLPILAAK